MPTAAFGVHARLASEIYIERSSEDPSLREDWASTMRVLRFKRELLLQKRFMGAKSACQGASCDGQRRARQKKRVRFNLEEECLETDSAHLKELQLQLFQQKKELLQLKCARLSLLEVQKDLPTQMAKLQSKLSQIAEDQRVLSEVMHAVEAESQMALNNAAIDQGGEVQRSSIGSRSGSSSGSGRSNTGSRLGRPLDVESELHDMQMRHQVLEEESEAESDSDMQIRGTRNHTWTYVDGMLREQDNMFDPPTQRHARMTHNGFFTSASPPWGRRFWTVRAPPAVSPETVPC